MVLYDTLKNKDNFFLLGGPCVIENREHVLYMASHLVNICKELEIPFVFKASFDKANRTSIDSYRGPGIEEGMSILDEVKTRFNVPIVTDIHEPWQCAIAAKTADILQIPAFMCRQTDLLLAAGKTGKIVNIKKGQFCNHIAMKHAYNKITSGTGNNNIIMTDRGNMYGYDDLVVDFRNLPNMRDIGGLVCQDVTHALQQPNRAGTTHGLRNHIPTIARSAVATGIDGLFMEIHNDPPNALSDATTQWYLSDLPPLLEELKELHAVPKRTFRYLN
jgi:2-dehydro-3-deoxyphosphooctonate aldolase (KDO 8-P synthase)